MTTLQFVPMQNTDLFIIATITTKSGQIIGFTSTENALNWQNKNYTPGLDFKDFANSTISTSDSESYPLSILNNNTLSGLFGANIELGFGSQNSPQNIYSFFIGNVISIVYQSQITQLNIAPIAYNLKRGVGEFFSAICRAEFGDARCQINTANYTFSGSITVVNGRSLGGNHPAQKPGYFVNGIIAFLNGNSFRILDDSGGNIIIATIPEMPINVGDKYSITAGCDKTNTTCTSAYQNIVNFRGEPFVNS